MIACCVKFNSESNALMTLNCLVCAINYEWLSDWFVGFRGASHIAI